MVLSHHARLRHFDALHYLNKLALRALTIARHYIELVILLAIVLIYTVNASLAQQHADAIIAEPRKSDFLFVDYFAIDSSSDGRFRYVPMKVISVEPSGVIVKVGNIGHTTQASPRRHVEFDRPLLLRNFYRVDTLFFTFEQLALMRAEGVIYDARRPDNIYIDGWIVIHKHEMFVEE